MALFECSECGKEVNGTNKFCTQCGCPINEGAVSKNSAKIIYEDQFFAVQVNIEVYFNDTLIADIMPGQEKEIAIDTNGTLLFKGSFRKTKVEVESNSNYKITLHWNRFTGQLVAKVDSFS